MLTPTTISTCLDEEHARVSDVNMVLQLFKSCLAKLTSQQRWYGGVVLYLSQTFDVTFG